MNKPEVIKIKGGRYYENVFEDFRVRVYMPDSDVPYDVINYCFETPYIMVFDEKDLGIAEEVAFAEAEGLDDAMRPYGAGVAFFYPVCEGGWKNAPADIFKKILDNSCIGQYNKDGYVECYNFFKREHEGFRIRGAVHRSFLYGVGEAADYIATNCMKKIEGEFLWGPGDITPVVISLRKASVLPKIERRDFVVVSSGNSDEFNAVLREKADNVLIDDEGTFGEEFAKHTKMYRRILGGLEKQIDLEEIGMQVDAGYEIVKTSPENAGDDRNTTEHKIGYVAYCNRELLTAGKKLPTLMAFHGGGDSAMIIGNFSSGWSHIAHRYGFLMICVENHLNSTATETVELIEKLKKKYPIDEERIYATGFSMGGIKSWDMFQEYPQVFAAAAPTAASTEPGRNVMFRPSPRLNEDTPLPVFYTGGEKSPLPELALQSEDCLKRLEYVLKVNDAKKQVNVDHNDKTTWEDPRWAIKGDETIVLASPQKEGRLMTLELFESKDGKIRTVFGSINDQQHEIHHHQCEYAYRFMSCFRRLKDGTTIGGEPEEIKRALT